MLLPIYRFGKDEIPEKGNCYVIAENGLFIRKDTGLVQAFVRVDGISSLDTVVPTAKLRTPLIPAKDVARAYLFFRKVYRLYRCEAIVFLFYNKEDKRFYLMPPTQKVSSAGLDYEYDPKSCPEGYRLIGDIHSHCGFGAFHSGVDREDEDGADGIHITIGNVNNPYPSISASLVVNKTRFQMNPAKVILGIREMPLLQRQIEGVKRFLGIERVENYENPAQEMPIALLAEESMEKPRRMFSAGSQSRWDFILPDNMDYRNIPVPKEWLKNVSIKKQSFTTHYDENSFNPVKNFTYAGAGK